MKKLLPIENYKKEILERFIEFRGSDNFLSEGLYHEMAYLYTQWAFADDVRRYVQLRYSLDKWRLLRYKLDESKEKEKIINGVYGLIDGVSDHGLENSRSPEGQLQIKERKKREEMNLKRAKREYKKNPNTRTRSIIKDDFGLFRPKTNCIHNIFKAMSLEDMLNWFEDFKHLDWFEQYFEIPVHGSGPDLIDLTNFAFMGYLNCSFDTLVPWTLRSLCNQEEGGKLVSKRTDPVKYVEKLIKNCKNFIANHPGERSALGDGNLLFKKVIRHAETRLQLDTKKYVLADDFAYITGINIRTLSNIGLIQPKKSGEERKILSKDALNFILKDQKPDGTILGRTRNRDMADNGLTRSFYSSIWQEQVFYSMSVDIDGDSLCWSKITCFKKSKDKKIKDKFKPDTVLRKTKKKLSPRVAIHNRTRVEWIGGGKTFEEINSPDSPYRNNIKRKTYIGNKSSIIEDLEYDLFMKWIELS